MTKDKTFTAKKKKLHVSEKNVAGFLFIFSTLIFTLEKTFRFVFVDRKFWRQVYVNFNFKPSSTAKNLVKFLSTPFSLHFKINNYFLRQKKVIKLIHKHHQIFWNINKIYSFFSTVKNDMKKTWRKVFFRVIFHTHLRSFKN